MRRPLLAVAFVFTAAAAHAQQPQNLYPLPRINSVFPAGAKAGTTVDATALGTDLDDPTALIFTHPGIKGEYVPPPEPPADPKKKEPAKKPGKKPQTTDAKFKIIVAANVPPGAYDVRVVNEWGVSNPRLFVVGDKAEVNEKESNNDTGEAQKVELGTTINGVIANSVDVDYSSFAAKAGQRVLIHCAASSIDSKLKPLIEVFAPDGRRLASARNYQDADALADVTIPSDGSYLVRLTEFAHQAGSAEHFYRLTISAGPWIDAVFPPAVEPGKPTNVTVYGRNLPGGKPAGVSLDGRPLESVSVSITPPIQPGQTQFRRRVEPQMALLDSFEYRLPGTNAIAMTLANGPVTLEKPADNDKPETAEAMVVPCDHAGRIEKRYDRDWYSFTAKKGDKYTIELIADRIGSNMDGFLTVRNATTKQDIANEGTLDDDPESLHPNSFFTRNADPVPFKFTAPADGLYLILVGSRDANVSYGPRSFYRLRVAAAKPDFRVVVMPRSRDLPTTVVAHPDGDVAFDVFVERLDDFAAPVAVTVEPLPAGVTAAPLTIGTNQKWGTLVLSAAGNLKDGMSEIKVKGTATIAGQTVVREARPASITWGVQTGQNVPTVARLDQSLLVVTRGGKSHFRIKPDLAAATCKIDGKDQKLATPFVVKPGDKITIPVKVAWQDKEARPNPLNIAMEPTQQNTQQSPVNVNAFRPVAVAKDKSETNVVVEVRSNAPPGIYSVPLRGETTVKFARDPEGKDKKDITVIAYAPPFDVKVIPTSLAKVSAQSPGNLKQGMTVELTVRVERQFDYDGPFAIAVELPKGTAGITIDAATIPPGANEVKVKMTAAKDAKIGGLNNIVVTASAKWDGQYETKQDAKFNLNIVK